jgi:hypothetical protein
MLEPLLLTTEVRFVSFSHILEYATRVLKYPVCLDYAERIQVWNRLNLPSSNIRQLQNMKMLSSLRKGSIWYIVILQRSSHVVAYSFGNCTIGR